MPSLTTYSAKFEQPITLNFHCEYCGTEFVNNGKYVTIIKINKWEPSYQVGRSPGQELQGQGYAKLEQIREYHNHMLKKEPIPHALGENDKIELKKYGKCPSCGYSQRISASPEIKKSTVAARVIASIGCLGFVLLIIGAALSAILAGTATITAYIGLVIATALLIAVVLIYLNRDPNKKFMKEHNLTKIDLPAPKMPDLVFGEIEQKGQYD